jgi:putative ABC transport system permease protein
VIRHLLKLVWNRKRANALIMVEIFFSFLVLVGVLTLALSTVARWGQPLGFDWRGVWMVQVDLPRMHSEADPKTNAVIQHVLDDIRTLPQVESVALSTMPPYSNGVWTSVWNIDGKRVEMMRDETSDDFAKVMRVQPIRGRWFGPQDEGAAYTPVVIDADLARIAYGDADPVGKKFTEDTSEMRIVGVIPPFRKSGELSPETDMAFSRISLRDPKAHTPHNLLLRVRPGTPGAFEETLTKRLHDLAPDLGFRVARMESKRSLMNRVRIMPVAVGGIVALFLISMVTLGLTGVLWQNVTRRTRELGLRRALGASGASVRRQVVAEVALLATIAVVLGVVMVAQLPMLGVFRIVTPQVFVSGVAAALAVIYGITIACGMYPGWLASRVPPAEALRYE